MSKTSKARRDAKKAKRSRAQVPNPPGSKLIKGVWEAQHGKAHRKRQRVPRDLMRIHLMVESGNIYGG